MSGGTIVHIAVETGPTLSIRKSNESTDTNSSNSNAIIATIFLYMFVHFFKLTI
jgi:hypothetical protein